MIKVGIFIIKICFSKKLKVNFYNLIFKKIPRNIWTFTIDGSNVALFTTQLLHYSSFKLVLLTTRAFHFFYKKKNIYSVIDYFNPHILTSPYIQNSKSLN